MVNDVEGEGRLVWRGYPSAPPVHHLHGWVPIYLTLRYGPKVHTVHLSPHQDAKARAMPAAMPPVDRYGIGWMAFPELT